MEDLLDSALARIGAAQNVEELEAVRVEVLGRKGVLAQLSKDMGKLSPDERVARGKFINAAKQSLESAYDAKKSAFESAALAQTARFRMDGSHYPGEPAFRRAACTR